MKGQDCTGERRREEKKWRVDMTGSVSVVLHCCFCCCCCRGLSSSKGANQGSPLNSTEETRKKTKKILSEEGKYIKIRPEGGKRNVPS